MCPVASPLHTTAHAFNPKQTNKAQAENLHLFSSPAHILSLTLAMTKTKILPLNSSPTSVQYGRGGREGGEDAIHVLIYMHEMKIFYFELGGTVPLTDRNRPERACTHTCHLHTFVACNTSQPHLLPPPHPLPRIPIGRWSSFQCFLHDDIVLFPVNSVSSCHHHWGNCVCCFLGRRCSVSSSLQFPIPHLDWKDWKILSLSHYSDLSRSSQGEGGPSASQWAQQLTFHPPSLASLPAPPPAACRLSPLNRKGITASPPTNRLSNDSRPNRRHLAKQRDDGVACWKHNS